MEHGLCLIEVGSSLKLGIRELLNLSMLQVALLGADSKYLSDELECFSDYQMIQFALGLNASFLVLPRSTLSTGVWWWTT